MRPTRDLPLVEVFAYPAADHARRHGPCGYVDDEHYKPWLRDEFHFRCVYCRCREVWFPDGDRNFSVEHLLPTSLAPDGLTDLDSLVYACCQCNAARGASLLPLDPCRALSQHLEVSRDGAIRRCTPEGEELIRICRLDRANLTAFRRLILDTLDLLRRKRAPDAVELIHRYLSPPANLPNLRGLKPPGGNSRPQGLEESYFEWRGRGESPAVG